MSDAKRRLDRQNAERSQATLADQLLRGKLHTLSHATKFNWNADAQSIVRKLLIEMGEAAAIRAAPQTPDAVREALANRTDPDWKVLANARKALSTPSASAAGPMAADIEQILWKGHADGKTRSEIAEEILREFETPSASAGSQVMAREAAQVLADEKVRLEGLELTRPQRKDAAS